MDKPTRDQAVQITKSIMRDCEAVLGTPSKAIARDYFDAPAEQRAARLSRVLRHAGEHATAWDAVSMIAQHILRTGEQLPRDLAAWVADQLDGPPKRPKSRGTDPYENAIRDQAVVFAVHVLVKAGFIATRNRSKGDRSGDGDSACDAVGVAHGMGYKAVERLWTASAKPDSYMTRNVLQRPVQ